MQDDDMCRVPINATFKEINGEMRMVQADWVDIPADTIARFLIQKCGVTPIFGGGDNN